MRPAALALAAVVSALLAGCTAAATSDAAAVGGGIAVGSVTANPAAAVATGLAIRAGFDALFKYTGRLRQGAEQDAIADAAAALPLGGTAIWSIHHTIPLGDEHGDLTVTRDISTRLAACKEVVFSVEATTSRALYTTQICRHGDRWKWAAAEPAVDRWGFLH